MAADGMQFRYGAYTHPKGEVYPRRFELRPQLTEDGIRWATLVRMEIAGNFVGESPEMSANEVNARIVELDNVYQYDYGDVEFLMPDGSRSAHSFNSNDLYNLSGNRIVHRSWDNILPSEYANTRSFTVVIEALFQENYSEILYFSETTERIGDGGPVWRLYNSWTNTPIKEQIFSNSKVYHIQRGTIIGLNTWPLTPSPYWPSDEQTWRRKIATTSPKFHGDLAFLKGTHYAKQYTYFFERLGP